MEQSNTQPSSTALPPVKQVLPQQDAIAVIHKPKGLTSTACIARIKKTFGQKKIGHGGTLDPMAEGVLLVLLGQATKLSGHLMDAGEKVYSGIIRLGVITDTWDAEGQVLQEVSSESVCASVTAESIQEAMRSLVGTYEQEVPAYSAAKHQGKPLYELARKGLETPVKRKVVTIFSGEVNAIDLPRVHFRVRCTSGTYIRSLAHSLGSRLGCGGMLEKLVREYSHPFGIEQAHSLERVLSDVGEFKSCLADIRQALPDWPQITVGQEDAARIKNGMSVAFETAHLQEQPFREGIRGLFLEEDGTPLGLVKTAASRDGKAWILLRGLWNTTP